MTGSKRRESEEHVYDREEDLMLDSDRHDQHSEDADHLFYEEDQDDNEDQEDYEGHYSYPEEQGEEEEDEDEEDEEEYSYHYDNDEGEQDHEENLGEDEVEGILGNSHDSGNRRAATLQELLGALAQGVESRRHGADGEGSDPIQPRRVNLADVFPEYREMFGMINGNNSRSSNNGNSRVAKLVQNVVNAQEDPYMAMESLREISEQLLMMNPLVAERTIPQEELLKSIVNILASPVLQGELELQLITCRCLYNLFETNPDTVSSAVDKDVITALQGKLIEISYIDLAEQVLETLEFISRVHGREILRSGGLVACLQYLDFFTIHAQRKAVTIVANSCARMRPNDFQHIQEVFATLNGIFINTTDQNILSKILNTLYGVCSGLGKEQDKLEKLFDISIIQRIIRLISNTDFDLESKLKSLDILSQLVTASANFSKQVIGSCNVVEMLLGCFNGFRKSPTSPLHETLMFVPKPLISSISRFIVLLLPTEEEQVLSIDPPKNIDLSDVKDEYIRLVKEITPLLWEIYTNTVDFDIRRCVLIAFSRICCSLNGSNVSTIDKQVINMIASSLTQNKSIFESSKGNRLISGGLLVGVLSLTSTMTAKYASEFLPAFKREGIFDLLKSLAETLSSKFPESTRENDDYDMCQEDEHESEEEEYEMEFDDMDIPDQVKPKKMKFELFRRLSLDYIISEMSKLLEILITNFSTRQDAIIEELQDIDNLVARLEKIELNQDSYEYWVSIWLEVKNKIFRENFTVSGFEFISTGLAREISRIIEFHSNKTSNCQRALICTFEKSLEVFVEILQHALTRLESFDIVECGLQGEEGRAASLGKQMKIKLEYAGDARGDKIPNNMKSIMVSIHCIASFKTLNAFLKHRILQSQFLSSLMPGLTRADQNPDDVKKWSFEFSLDETPVSYNSTIFGAIFKHFTESSKELSTIWNSVQSIKYRRMYEKEENFEIGELYPQRTFGANELKPANEILNLLDCVKNSSLRDELFVNSKLSAKLSRQLEEPLIVAGGVLPSWALHITRHYPFLFLFETRMFFLQSTSFGYGRLIQLWRNRTGNDKDSNGEDPLQQLGRPTRHKLRISRDNMFLSALKIINKYGSTPNILEIEYQNEVGTGLGPTLEFYASVSKDFAKKSLRMWRCNDYATNKTEGFVEELLFPAPMSSTEDESRILELFGYLGTFVARSMLDNRILDFRFSKVFFQLMHLHAKGQSLDLNQPEQLIDIVSMVDAQIGRSLQYLYDNQNSSNLESLALTFTVPGYDIELVENGGDIVVNSANVRTYIEKVIDQILQSGIEKQIKSFIQGFSKAFPYTSLSILTPEELSDLYGRVEEDWSEKTLYSFINADHGYNMDSATIHDLVSVLSSFNRQEQRLFLQFLTGSPKLPIGGFKSLKPRLTVVLKHTEDNLTPDEYLPSVMTCANYLKLPKYSCREILRSRIVQAMNEGSGAFLLS